MANMPAIDKRKVSLLLPIRTVVKLDKAARLLELSRNEIAAAILDKGTNNVELTKEELDEIHAEMEINLEKRKNQ